MKKLITGVCLIAFVCAICLPAAAQVLWRSAKTMKQGSYIAMVQWYYMDYTQKWDSANEEWVDNDKDQLNWGFETMFGYAVTDHLEMMVHIPYYFKTSKSNSDEFSEEGIGDIMLKARLGIFPWTPNKHGFLMTSTLRLPTGSTRYEDSFCRCGDGSLDYGLGGIFSTKWMRDFRGHLKLNYWFNGTSYTGNDIGDEYKLIVKLDRNFHQKFMGFATYIHITKWSDVKTTDGTVVPNKDKKRHILVLGGVYKPKKGVFIRPKIAIALGGEKRINYTVKPMLDLWYIFTI